MQSAEGIASVLRLIPTDALSPLELHDALRSVESTLASSGRIFEVFRRVVLGSRQHPYAYDETLYSSLSHHAPKVPHLFFQEVQLLVGTVAEGEWDHYGKPFETGLRNLGGGEEGKTWP